MSASPLEVPGISEHSFRYYWYWFFDLDEVVALGCSSLDLVRTGCSCIHNKQIIQFPDPGHVPVPAKYNIHTAPVEKFKHIHQIHRNLLFPPCHLHRDQVVVECKNLKITSQV